MIDRILRGTVDTIQATAPETGIVPDAATVTITRQSDNTTIAFNAATTPVGDAFTYEVDATATAQLDLLSAVWSFTAGGIAQGSITTTHEIVGDFLFTIAEARKLRPLDRVTEYPTADIEAMRTTVEDALEDACGVAFVPRYGEATLNGGDTLLRLTPYLRTVRWASTTAGGVTTPLTADALSVLQISEAGFVSGYPWTVGYGNIRVGYEHGMDRPPERVKRAALLLAKVWLVSGPVDDRATSFSSAETGATYSMVVPGRGGSITGVPEVDATIQQYRMPVLA